jgi:hypothetical protein
MDSTSEVDYDSDERFIIVYEHEWDYRFHYSAQTGEWTVRLRSTPLGCTRKPFVSDPFGRNSLY